MLTLFIVVGLIEIYYWFVVFPKLWNDGSNREIEDIKCYLDVIGNFHNRKTDAN